MRIGIIGGTGASFGFIDKAPQRIVTRRGAVDVETARSAGGAEVVLLARHGFGHSSLSSQVDHRANILAMKEAGVDAIIATTACGIVDPALDMATPIVFDEVFFPDNRLPDGSPCTLFETPGEAGRGHYIFDTLLSPAIRAALLEGAREAGIRAYGTGTYAYMLGPRFNTKSEIAHLRAAGASMISQTAAPEAVLAGELEIPYALLGYGTDYANGVRDEATPLEVLNENLAGSKAVFSRIIEHAVDRLAETPFDTGFVYRFE